MPVLTDPKFDFFEPIPVDPPLAAARSCPIAPIRRATTRWSILHDIYEGPGLKGVPRGTIKQLRIAAYHFGFPGMAGPDKIGRAGPWEAMRILGTVPVYEDGSAKFRVPANTPITLQALDEDGKAVQLMRTWYTAMPGETASCVGCHETPQRRATGTRTIWPPACRVSEIEPWYGPAARLRLRPRSATGARPALRRLPRRRTDGMASRRWPTCGTNAWCQDYVGLPLTRLGATRIDPSIARNAIRTGFRPCRACPNPTAN